MVGDLLVRGVAPRREAGWPGCACKGPAVEVTKLRGTVFLDEISGTFHRRFRGTWPEMKDRE